MKNIEISNNFLESSVVSVIESIHASPLRFSLKVAGAGASAVASLASVPGCSNTLIECQFPYSMETTDALLDYSPDKYVSDVVGRQMSQHAYMEACTTVGAECKVENIVGLGGTSAIKTNRSRLGFDHLYLSCWGHKVITSYELNLPFNKTRLEQEAVVGRMIIVAMAEYCGIELSDSLREDWGVAAAIKTVHNKPSSPLISFLNSEVSHVIYNRFGEVRMKLDPYASEYWRFEKNYYFLCPGSFHPIHVGHLELARAAIGVFNRSRGQRPSILTYEMSVNICDKGKIDVNDLTTRICQFRDFDCRVAITRARLFVEKARLFRNHALIVGIDTARRVLDPKYYNNSASEMLEALDEIRQYGCFFMVGGRKLPGGQWDSWSNVHVPREVADMFIEISEGDFRVDISSTEIRARRETDDKTSGSDSPAGEV